MFELTKETFNAVTFGVHDEVAFALILDVRARRDDGLCFGFLNSINNFLAVISFIGKNILSRKSG